MNLEWQPSELEKINAIQLLSNQSKLFAAQFVMPAKKQLSLFDSFAPSEPQQNDWHDPQDSHETYEYCQRLLRNYLPACKKPKKISYRELSDEENLRYTKALHEYHRAKQIRDTILEAKNVYLTGKEKTKNGKRGACGRSEHLSKLLGLKKLLENWIRRGSNPAELLYELQNQKNN